MSLLELDCSYDHPDIIAGHGTMGLEMIEQVPDLDAVLVPVGGAGLVAGVALAIKSLHPGVLIYVCRIITAELTPNTPRFCERISSH